MPDFRTFYLPYIQYYIYQTNLHNLKFYQVLFIQHIILSIWQTLLYHVYQYPVIQIQIRKVFFGSYPEKMQVSVIFKNIITGTNPNHYISFCVISPEFFLHSSLTRVIRDASWSEQYGQYISNSGCFHILGSSFQYT